MRPLAVALLLAVPTLAADKEKPATLDEQIKEAKLSEAEVKALKEHGFVVGEAEYKQVFTPYLGGDLPRFVTADSLLNAFHVVFEESVFRMEQANARKLPTILADIEKHLPAAEKALTGDKEMVKKAGVRARVFLGTARALLDPKVLPSDADERKLVGTEVGRVTAAKGKEKPVWLGKSDDGFLALDYSRFKPRGFYTRSPKMEAYFRAVSWLQAIPWRVDRDDEFAAILLLAEAHKTAAKQKNWVGEEFWSTFDEFLGTGDALDLPDAASYIPGRLTADALAESRKKASEWATGHQQPEVNDQLRFQPDTPDGKPEVHYRFVSAYRLPDAVLLQRTATDKRMPSGLDVAAALGSPFARKKLDKELFRKVETNEALFAKPGRYPRPSLYADYLACLRELVERTEPDAPKVFASDAWTAKTCQTALGGWAQMRHTWVLQAKQTEHYLSAFRTPDAGFVEPVPEFYAKFAAMVKRSGKLLEVAGAFDPALESKLSVKQAQAVLDALATVEKKGLAALKDEERNALRELIPTLPESGDPKSDQALRSDLNRAALIAGTTTDDDRPSGMGLMYALPNPMYCMTSLEEMCDMVERLAHKQLRGVAFSKDEQKFLKRYGEELAGIMFYGGNSYSDAKDDAPRIVDVHTDPQKGKVLEVGIGRPRVLWVVYPWKGADVLCRGAVLPYHEFASPDRLTDKEWLKLLDSPKAPEQPNWVNGWTVPREKKEK